MRVYIYLFCSVSTVVRLAIAGLLYTIECSRSRVNEASFVDVVSEWC